MGEKVLNIAVCDNDERFIMKVRQIIAQNYPLTCFHSAQELLESYQAGKRFDLLILNVIIGQSSGITIAKIIRKMDKQVMLVFIADDETLINQTLEVKPERYLLKDSDDDILCQTIRRCYRHYRDECRALIFTVRNSRGEKEHLALTLAEILYFESANRLLMIYTKAGQVYATEAKISALSALLHDKGFCSCHRSYLVNLAYVQAVSAGGVTIRSSAEQEPILLPLARSKKVQVLNDFIAYKTNEPC